MAPIWRTTRAGTLAGMKLLLRLLATALAAGVAALVVPGITLSGGTWTDQAVTLLVVALVVGAVNLVVKPVVQVLSGCLIVLTFGLFLLVINAGMLLLSSWLAGQFGVGFHVDGWWAALLGSIIISVVSGLLNGVTGAARVTSD